MAPIRRYLRITPHTALETRIYLDNPTDANWLLKPDTHGSNTSDTALQRIIKAVQPLVLPKLREENTRTRTGAKGKKTKGVKDTVSGDDFEASVFLVESGSRHAVLVRHRDVKPEHASEGRKKWDWQEWRDRQRGSGDEDEDGAVVIREEDEDDDEGSPSLTDYPEINTRDKTDRSNARKRRRKEEEVIEVSDDEGFAVTQPAGDVNEGDVDAEESTKQGKQQRQNNGNRRGADDKKKVGLVTRYDGFSIYGRILCLIIKRRGSKSRAIGSTSLAEASAQDKGRDMLENWVSTQAQRDVGAEEVE